MDGDVSLLEPDARCVASHASDAINHRLGMRIRAIRKRNRLTLIDVAAAMGCSTTQVWKYEMGRGRMFANTIYRMACVLGVRVEVLLEGIDPAAEPRRLPLPAAMPSDVAADCPPEAMELVNALHSISSPKVRRQLRRLVQSLAEEAEVEERGARAEPQPELATSRGRRPAVRVNGVVTYSL